MKALDLFCGAGGMSEGLRQAGFTDITGVDINPQPNYPFRFIRANALGRLWVGYDYIHASPPCQGYSRLRHMWPDRADGYPLMIEATRALLGAIGVPYSIENVPGAPLRDPVLLCGSMFGLGAKGGYLRRHRLFECSFPVLTPACSHQGRAVGVYGHGGHSGKHRMLNKADASEAMQIDWMNRDELAQALPPAYGELIGHYARRAVR